MLETSVWGTGEAVVAVHGFTQSGRSWGRLGQGLGEAHRVVALDAPGHGGSASVTADLDKGADLMVEAASMSSARPATWLGYSMGGRYCLHVALRHPDAVTKLVLISATGGIDSGEERAERRRSDAALADKVEAVGVERFVADWLRLPLFATLPSDAAALESRLGGSPAGLASSLRLAGTGSQEPLWDRLGALEMPVLVVAGRLDAKYCALADRLAASIGSNATLQVIEDAGHACHLERPDEVLAVVEAFLGRPPSAQAGPGRGPTGSGG